MTDVDPFRTWPVLKVGGPSSVGWSTADARVLLDTNLSDVALAASGLSRSALAELVVAESLRLFRLHSRLSGRFTSARLTLSNYSVLHELGHRMLDSGELSASPEVSLGTLALVLSAGDDEESGAVGERQFEWVDSQQALNKFLETVARLGRRIDAARQSKAALVASAREERFVSRVDEPPGHAVPASRRPPRGPDVSLMDPTCCPSVPGEAVRAAA